MLKNRSSSKKIKERIIKLRQRFLAFILITLLSINTATILAQNNNIKSPALETLIQQIDKNYVPLEWNMEELSKTIPQVYFTFLGAAMKKQEFYTNNNPAASKNFNILNNEILSLIPNIVNLYNSAISDNDKPINTKGIEDIYYGALMGNINEDFIQNYKKNTGKDLTQISMPFVLDIDGKIFYKKLAKKDKNEINLLGEVAPKVEYKGNDQDQPPLPPRQPSRVDSYSGPKQWEGLGCQCPQKAPSDDENQDLSTATAYRYLDCNGDPYDDTYTKCTYRGLGEGKGYFLAGQYPFLKGKKHGATYIWNNDVTNGNIFLYAEENYFNGKKEGIQKKWNIDQWNTNPRDRPIYLEYQDNYVNGKRQGINISYGPDGQIRSRSKYIDGKFIENY